MEISEIKQRLSIKTVLKHYGLQANRNHMLKCPFHDEKEPSLKIYPDTNTFNCFGCKANGDTIEFIQLKEKCSKHAAILKAKELLAVPTVKDGKALKKATELINPVETTKQTGQVSPKPEPVQTKSTNHQSIIEKTFALYRSSIVKNLARKPQDYLKARNLNLKKLEVGYNSGQYHHRKRMSEQDVRDCLKAGLLMEYEGFTPNGDKVTYTAFARECIIFPLKDKQNKVVSIYGRSVNHDNKGKHYYLKDRQGLYPGYPNPKTAKVILTEAIIDAATLQQLKGINKGYSVLALYGTNGLTPAHRQVLQELPELQEVIMFFDGDRAGNQAKERYKVELKELLPETIISAVETPGGEDINSLHQMYDNEKYFLELLQNRVNLLETATSFLLTETITESSPEASGTPNNKKEQQVIPAKTKLNTTNPEQIIYETPELKITIWGGIEKENLSRLKVSMHIKSKANKYKSFRDDVNLYSHGNTQKLIQNISETLEVSTTAIVKTITELTEELEAYRLDERTAMAKALKPKLYEMSEDEKQTALSFLKGKGKGLGKKTLELIQQSGLIGEEKNGLLLYFLYTSRLMDEPLYAIIFGKSGSCKTYLQTKISECLPEESVRTITSLTENTLYYSAKDFWKHKVLLIEDLEGVYNAFLPLREFMSKQSISKLTTDFKSDVHFNCFKDTLVNNAIQN